ncbi:MAG TPA: hypothetical protein VH497_12040 [Vicinamibacterales bacterium]|jgi:hypothetical protein
MRRREFIEKAGLGSALVTLPAIGGSDAKTANKDAKQSGQDSEHGHGGGNDEMNGPLSTATVSFGQWDLATPLDRFPNNSPRTRNNHHLIPNEVKIKAGGSVNFMIGGFHHILVYGNDTKPSDINIGATIPTTVQPGPPLINDPVNRVYRGLDPSVLPALPGSTPPQPLQDRTETVRFTDPGRYLVICGVLPHFFDVPTGQFIMFGYVNVIK